MSIKKYDKLNFPSLDVAKELTRHNFPITQHIYYYAGYKDQKHLVILRKEKKYLISHNSEALCPSIGEMIDFIKENNIDIKDVNILSDNLPDILAKVICDYYEHFYHNNRVLHY